MRAELGREALEQILNRHRRQPLALLQVLREVQAAAGCVSATSMAHIAAALGLPIGQIQGVVSFYAFLSAEPRGDYQLYLSDSITDRMLGNGEVIDTLCQALAISPGQTRADGRVSLHLTSCTGLCDQGPAGLINERPLVRLDAQRAADIARRIEAHQPLAQWPADYFTVHNPLRRRDAGLNASLAPGQALRRCLAAGAEAMWRELHSAGLRGRGGAGFSLAGKWQACRDSPGEHIVVCNADEGEPGTFKDRFLLMEHAGQVIEGMSLAALLLGARRGFIYLRGEYAFIRPALQQALAEARRAGLLGPDILGSGHGFEIEIHLGAGAYVCGEETALLDSLQGLRGIPRIRPPFPASVGYLGQPTLVNNVESYFQAVQIAALGGAWFAAQGTEASRGTRVLSVSGDVARPGLYEYPWGTPVRQILAEAGAEQAIAVQVGGPSGQLIAPHEYDRCIAFEDLPTGGSFIAFGPGRDILEVVQSFAHFFAHESCGFCTPCRVGSDHLARQLDRLCRGQLSRPELDALQATARLLRDTSQCGLGQTAGNPLRDALRRFPALFEARLSPEFVPLFDLEQELAPARQLRHACYLAPGAPHD